MVLGVEPCRNCGEGTCACVFDVVGPSQLSGSGSAAAPWVMTAGVTADDVLIHGTGLPADPLTVDSLCDQTLALPVDVPALTDRVVLTDGTDCKTALISDLPFPPPDPCVIIQDYFTPPPAAVPALTPAAVMAVISDGAGGWTCSYLTNVISVSAPTSPGGSGSPGSGSNQISLGPNGINLTLTALGGIDVTTNGLIAPGVIYFAVRDSNVAWSYAGSPSSGGSNVYVDPVTRRIYGEPAYVQADATSHTVDAVVGTLALAANTKTFTAAAHTVILNNPSASRAMRTQFIATWGGVNMSRNTPTNLNWNLDWMVNAAIIDFGYMGIMLAAAPVATISSNQFGSYPVGNFTIAAGGSATFQTRPWLFASGATTASRLGPGYRYGVSVHGWSL